MISHIDLHELIFYIPKIYVLALLNTFKFKICNKNNMKPKLAFFVSTFELVTMVYTLFQIHTVQKDKSQQLYYFLFM